MTEAARYFSVRGQATDDQAEDLAQLVERWRLEPELRQSILDSLRAGNDLPAALPTIECTTLNSPIKLVDLRGLDLSGESIGAVDLSYCCFDFARFDRTELSGTHIQFSSFAFASFEGSSWVEVQASPISAPRARFTGSTMKGVFMMRSDLEGADLSHAQFSCVHLVGSNLQRASLTGSYLRELDVAEAMIDTEVAKDLARADMIKGLKQTVLSPHKTKSHQHFDLDLLADLNLVSNDLSGERIELDRGTNPTHRGARSQLKILVVDDSRTALSQSQSILSTADFDVHLAESGADALKKIREVQPDLVLLDIEMPAMNGLEVARKVRSDSQTQDVPIVMMSAHFGKYEYQVLNAGVQGFFAKPANPTRLVNRVERLATAFHSAIR